MSQLNIERFAELRAGFWDVVFHTELPLVVKRSVASYFRSADRYVVENGGESKLDHFNETCRACGYESLIALHTPATTL